MKSAMPHAGLTAPELRSLCRRIFAAHPMTDARQWQDTIADLWRNAQVREMRYAAIELLLLPRYRKQWLAPDTLALIREMVESGAWWDFIDTLATNAVGDLLQRYPEDISAQMHAWANDENLWVRRTAILCQLKCKTRTDEALLFAAIEGSIGDADFFARKAIGWALRQYSRTAPQTVINYVKKNKTRLSPLSKREALRLLVKEGVIDKSAVD